VASRFDAVGFAARRLFTDRGRAMDATFTPRARCLDAAPG